MNSENKLGPISLKVMAGNTIYLLNKIPHKIWILGSAITVGLSVGLGAGLGVGLKSNSTPNESISFITAADLVSNIIGSEENKTDPYFLPTPSDGSTFFLDAINYPLRFFDYSFIDSGLSQASFSLSVFNNFKNEGESSDSNIPLGTELWMITYDNTTATSQSYVLSLTFTGTADSVLYIGAGLPSNN